jgi:hypothetical protein
MFCLGIRLRFSLQIGCSMKVESRFFVIEGNARFNDHSARNQTTAADGRLIFDRAAARVWMFKIMHALRIAGRSGALERTSSPKIFKLRHYRSPRRQSSPGRRRWFSAIPASPDPWPARPARQAMGARGRGLRAALSQQQIATVHNPRRRRTPAGADCAPRHVTGRPGRRSSDAGPC